jgi:hypothetical protein
MPVKQGRCESGFAANKAKPQGKRKVAGSRNLGSIRCSGEGYAFLAQRSEDQFKANFSPILILRLPWLIGNAKFVLGSQRSGCGENLIGGAGGDTRI